MGRVGPMPVLDFGCRLDRQRRKALLFTFEVLTLCLRLYVALAHIDPLKLLSLLLRQQRV
jgi:hypothetical protein